MIKSIKAKTQITIIDFGRNFHCSTTMKLTLEYLSLLLLLKVQFHIKSCGISSPVSREALWRVLLTSVVRRTSNFPD